MKSVKPKESKFQRFIHTKRRIQDTAYKIMLMSENVMHLPIPFEDFIEYLDLIGCNNDVKQVQIDKNTFKYYAEMCGLCVLATVKNDKVINCTSRYYCDGFCCVVCPYFDY